MAISFSGYTLVPDLQHWYREFVLGSVINKGRIPPPTDINPINFPEQSFTNVLFNDDYALDYYEYTYSLVTDFFCVPPQASRRLQIYPGMWQYVNLDVTGDNIFELNNDDLIMLDSLLAYRMWDATALTVIDSTSTNVIIDSTSGYAIISSSVGALSTCLSKMIYLYLDLQVNGNYEGYNNLDLISVCDMNPKSLLCNMFESYLIDAYMKYMLENVPNLIQPCPPTT
jgi:hypothetical protein